MISCQLFGTDTTTELHRSATHKPLFPPLNNALEKLWPIWASAPWVMPFCSLETLQWTWMFPLYVRAAAHLQWSAQLEEKIRKFTETRTKTAWPLSFWKNIYLEKISRFPEREARIGGGGVVCAHCVDVGRNPLISVKRRGQCLISLMRQFCCWKW